MGFRSRKGSGSRRSVRHLRVFRPGVDSLPIRELLSGVPFTDGVVLSASGGGQLSAGNVEYDLSPGGTLWQVSAGTQVQVEQRVAAAAAHGGYVYELLSDGQLFQTPVGGTSLTLVAGEVGQIAVDGSGALDYLNTTTNSLYAYKPGSGATLIAGEVGQIAVDGSGALDYLNTTTHSLYTYKPGSGATLIAGEVGQIGRRRLRGRSTT